MRKIIVLMMFSLFALACSTDKESEHEELSEEQAEPKGLKISKETIDRDTGLYIKEMLSVGEDSIGTWTLKAFMHESLVKKAEALVLINDTTYSTRYYYKSLKPFAVEQIVKFQGMIIEITEIYFNSQEIIDMEASDAFSRKIINNREFHSLIYEQAIKLAEGFIDEEAGTTENLKPLDKFSDIIQ